MGEIPWLFINGRNALAVYYIKIIILLHVLWLDSVMNKMFLHVEEEPWCRINGRNTLCGSPPGVNDG